ncbi:hypothetical protein [Myroides odoratus]|uniref:Uncharacterized protein n=1 Tax=Myroides odoratus TaxID=256 RepID=A0A378RIR0_MYROD|nr:hypothetical protein [Myroides odoratus]QQU02475.1 hypothetical protein I6I89_11505 [Myroides odoratus]STZ26578.1 Uncharacterised protein [Myroides odoratus]
MRKLLKTNLINVIIVFIVVYIYSVIRAMKEADFNIFQGMFSALILVVLYGMFFWIAFFILLLLTNVFILKKSSKQTFYVMFVIQTVVVSIPFIYLGIYYEEWIFIVGVIGFLVSQMYRSKKIRN